MNNTNGLIPVDEFELKFSVCNDPQHNPPSHLFIPPGYVYKHVCPSCGSTAYLQPDVITC